MKMTVTWQGDEQQSQKLGFNKGKKIGQENYLPTLPYTSNVKTALKDPYSLNNFLSYK